MHNTQMSVSRKRKKLKYFWEKEFKSYSDLHLENFLKKKRDLNHARFISFFYLETSDFILAFCVGAHQLVGQTDDGKYVFNFFIFVQFTLIVM
jgi:hypothetical protein